jgi:CheY-like chemotaxis protein
MEIEGGALTDAVMSPLSGLDVLLVEDEAIVAMVTEDMLKDAGCANVWTVGSVSAALELLKKKQPHLGLLDVNLRGETCFEIAAELERLKIPFALATGYGRGGMPKEWSHATIVPKPYTQDVLVAQLARALKSASAS